MRYANTLTLPTTADSVYNLLNITDDFGAGFVIIQAPAANAADANFGTNSIQPAFIIPGGSAEVRLTDLKNLYVKGNGTDTLIVLVL